MVVVEVNMRKKTFTLVSTITTCVSGIAIAVVTYFNPAYCEAINGSIAVAEGAIITICSKFVKD